MSDKFDQDDKNLRPSDISEQEEYTPSSHHIFANLKARIGLEDRSLPPDTSIPMLLAALNSQEWAERTAAARRLGKLAPPEAHQPLTEALKTDPEASVRAATARALGKMQVTEAETPLVNALRDSDDDIRIAAAQALSALAQHLSKETIKALVESFFSEEDAYTRAALIAALGNLGERTPLDILEAGLQDEEWPVREAAALALGKQGERADRESLEIALDDESIPVCQAAIAALSKLVSEEAEVLVNLEADEKPSHDNEARELDNQQVSDENPTPPAKNRASLAFSPQLESVPIQTHLGDTIKDEYNQKGVSDNVEFIKLVPSSIRGSLPAISQVFDDQWIPNTLLTAVLKGKIAYPAAQKYLDYLARTEYMRSLLNSEHLIINRAFIYNNPWLYRGFLPGATDREAFKGLLEQGVIVPFLYTEAHPAERTSWLSIYEDGFSAWVNICKEVQVQCMRFSWDSEQNQKRAQKQLAYKFHDFATTAYAREIERFLKDLGLDSSQEKAFATRLDQLQDASFKYFQKNDRQHVVRTFLYEQFVTAGNPSLRQYDGSKHFSGAIKQLLDLAYNSGLADALGCHLITPADSPTRLVLQDWNKLEKDLPSITAANLMEMLSKDTFQIMQQALAKEGLKSMAALNLRDILELRQTDEWLQYISRLRRLLDNPLQFRELANDVAASYIMVTDQITRRIRDRNLRSGGILMAPWNPAVEVTVTIGGLDTTFLWSKDGLQSSMSDKPPIAQIKDQIQVDPLTGSAMCNIRLTITDAQRKSEHAQISSRIEVLQGRLENAHEQWEEVVRKVGAVLQSQEFAGETERTATINQAGALV